MIYLISQDWANTSNNHAGIKYLCEQLQLNNKDDIVSIVIPDFRTKYKFSKYSIIRRLQNNCYLREHRHYLNDVFNTLKKEAVDGDKIILMEYMERLYPTLFFAQKAKKEMPNVALYAMIHLVPSKLDAAFNSTCFKEWMAPIDRILTLGSSLTDYLVKRGVGKDKIITTFHYVDNKYYSPTRNPHIINDEIKVIAMGNQMRNISLLQKICEDNPTVKFTICQGVFDMSEKFDHLSNVTLIPFVPEDELKRLMDESDISLNSMEDTIGSNVIVTSMAMGLAMVCSDVGSIRNYCDESNCNFCDNNNVSSFSDAIKELSVNRKILASMKNSSFNKASKFAFEQFERELLKY